ncbi:hypothetical protein OH807_37840 [Kitasatospora sp. NBC_01560]|uniref:hypothetical protein n=1 Tax=Kitasatospora sp. NBC_01560 TaxID=2975965 RepID=UPI00386EC0F2
MTEPDTGRGRYGGPTGYGPGRPGHDRSGDGPEPAEDTEVERELRILLHRDTPHLSAPADRMDRIIARADRTRRRRRTAALAAGLTTGLVAAALAAAPALAPGPANIALRPATAAPPLPGGTGGTGGTAGGPAANAPGSGSDAEPGTGPASGTSAGSAPTATPSMPSASGAAMYPLRFPDLGGLVVDLPAGWSAMSVPSGKPQIGYGYLANRSVGASPCSDARGDCDPLGHLADGAVLVTMTLIGDRVQVEKLSGSTAPAVDTVIDKPCGVRGGTRQLVGHRSIGLSGPSVLVELTACLNKPAPQTVLQVQSLLDSLRTTGNAAIAPGSSHS